MSLICPTCGRAFDTADRVQPTALAGSEAQVKYCSETCARTAENKRHYLRHRAEILAKARERKAQGDEGQSWIPPRPTPWA